MARMQPDGVKYEIEFFYEKSNFTLQQSTIMGVLTIQELNVTFENDKPTEIKKTE